MADPRTAAHETPAQELPDDLARFDELYLRHSHDVLAFFSRRVLEPQLAMDLTAETFAQALAGRERIRRDDPDAAVRWLYGIAHHLLSHSRRRRRSQESALRRLGVQAPILGSDEHERVEELAMSEELRANVRRAFDDLPQPQRDVLRLRVIEEQPYERVAAELNITEEAARMRVTRALRELAVRFPIEAQETS